MNLTLGQAMNYFFHKQKMSIKKNLCLCWYANQYYWLLENKKLIHTTFEFHHGCLRNEEVQKAFEGISKNSLIFQPLKPLIHPKNARFLDGIFRRFGSMNGAELDLEIALHQEELKSLKTSSTEYWAGYLLGLPQPSLGLKSIGNQKLTFISPPEAQPKKVRKKYGKRKDRIRQQAIMPNSFS